MWLLLKSAVSPQSAVLHHHRLSVQSSRVLLCAPSSKSELSQSYSLIDRN